jgi:branched-chain amino acid transport system permease protein
MDGLRAERMGKAFGGLLAVDEVSISVRSNEVVGLIGPNGSGKTTLLNLIAGVHRPDQGRIAVDGRDITGHAAHRVAREGIARTFQSVRLFPSLNALEHVEVGSRARGRTGGVRPRLVAWDALERFGLTWYVGNRPSTLPHGVQRRLEIARALAGGPRYLLLDEPAAGLNEAESDDLLRELRAIHSDLAIGLLVIDHDLRLIMRLCDRIVVLNEGHLVAEGSPSEVQENPEVIAAYIGEQRDAGRRPSRHEEP